MSWQYTPYNLPIALVTIVTLAYVAKLWRTRHRHPTITTGIYLLLAGLLWLTSNGLELAGADLATKVFWNKMQFAGIVLVPSLWLVIALQLSKQDHWLQWRYLRWLVVVPAIMLILVITNEAHHIVWQHNWLDTSGSFNTLEKTPGIGVLAFVTYSFVLGLFGDIVLLRQLYRTGRLFQWQGGLVILTVILVILVAAVELADLTFLPAIELTPVILTLLCPIVVFLIFRLRRSDIMVVAHNTIINKLVDAMIVVDAEGIVLDLNPAAEKLTGQPIADMVGRRLYDIWAGFATLTLLPTATATTQEITVPDGKTERTYDALVSPITNWQDQVVSYAIVLRDISARIKAERHQMELALERERVKASERFITDVSHDFRTPLTTMKLNLYLINKAINKGKPFTEHLETLDEQINYLAKSLDDILLMARLDHTDSLSTLKRVDVNPLVRQITTDLQPETVSRQITLAFTPAATRPSVQADENSLRQALLNIIQNAICYTPSGGHVDVSVLTCEGQVIVEVTDTGIGISPADRERIFERFYRADEARNKQNGSTGLGLAIARRIVHLHGGQIEVESTLGQGSTFRVLLPEDPRTPLQQTRSRPSDLNARQPSR